jgi:hypothetical protein
MKSEIQDEKEKGRAGMRNKSGGCSDPSLRLTDGEPKMK